MDVATGLLQTYQGRDKIMRTVSYAAMFLTGGVKGKAAVDLGTIAKQVSAARTVGRLFDDLLMLAVTKGYGLGYHERDPINRLLQIVGNVSIQTFFPFEHIAWLGTNGILTGVNPSRWTTYGLICWAIYIVCALLKCVRNIGKINYKTSKLVKQQKLESPERSGEADAAFQDSLRDLKLQKRLEVHNIIKNLADLANAVSWLPAGFLWAGKLTAAQNGFFGTVSSLIGLCQLVAAEKKKKSS